MYELWFGGTQGGGSPQTLPVMVELGGLTTMSPVQGVWGLVFFGVGPSQKGPHLYPL